MKSPTGAGGSSSGVLTELDETAVDVIGRDSSNEEPVKLKDSDIVFGEEILKVS